MTVVYIVVDNADGTTILRSGTVAEQDVAANAGVGETAFIVPNGFIAYPTPNFAPLVAQLAAKVDTECEEFRSSFVTEGETQQEAYRQKEQQALAWQADNSSSVPMIEGEAARTGVTVATLVATVLAKAALWRGILNITEPARIGAKKDIVDAAAVGNVIDMFAAANVDWTGLLP